jgi:iron complex outermembrane recepter protein
MQKKWMVLWLALCAIQSITAQIVMSGKVTDSDGKPLSFVSVVLERNKQRLGFTATNESGQFRFALATDSSVYFSFRFSLPGYKSAAQTIIYPDTTSLTNIVLEPEPLTLGNVTVTSNRPLVTRKPDRYIINVENSFLANGNSALDVLQRSPGLWVDNNGGIRIRGNQSVTVMVNDVVQRMTGDELTEYLKTLRSEDISKIEVIPNPPAEYEAAGAGGIVHIVLKKARKDGLNGSVFVQYRQQGHASLYGPGLSADYKAGSFYITGGLSLIQDLNHSYGNNASIFTDGSYFNSVGTRRNDNGRQQYRLSMSFDISETQLLVIQSVMGGTQMRHEFFNEVEQRRSSGQQIAGTNYTDWLRNMFQTSTNALYQLKTDTIGSIFKLKAEYTTGNRSELNTFTGIYSDPTLNEILISNTPSETNIFSAQADHVQVLNKLWQFRSGIKYAGIRRNNRVANLPFIYHENLLMGYGTIEKNIKKTSIKLGIRAEQTWSKGKSANGTADFSKAYIGLFPSLFVSRILDEQKGTGIFFSYARRLQRPAFNELNPYRLQLSTIISIIGNPNLTPQYTHNFELGTQLGKGWSLTTYLSLTTDIISQLTIPVSGKIENQYLNIDRNSTYGINIEAPVRVTKTWIINHSFSLYHADFTIQSFRNKRTAFSLRQIHNFQWPGVVDIDLATEYRSAYVNANSKTADFCYTDLGFSRRMIKGKARLRFSISDIFNVTREAAQTDYLGVHTEFYQKRQTRNYALIFSYNFSFGKKFTNKRMDQSSSEERNRIGN